MVCFLTGYASCAASASLPAWLAHLLSAVSAASACERTALNCNKTSVFSRVQARSAPRAHVRELLCVSQSSKERLRRSRTESSGAAPAIEELAGEARQVRPAGPRADQSQPGSDFSRAKRSGGRPALQLPRVSNSCGSSAYRLSPARAPQKSEFFASLLFPFMNQNITGRSHREYHGLEPGVRAGRFLHNASGAVAEHFPAE